MTQPPRVAERLLRWSLAVDERDAVLGDLQEEFAEIASTDPVRALRWYWSQAALSIGPNLARRARRRADVARRLESPENRASRLKARAGGAVLVVGGMASALGITHSGLRDPFGFYFAIAGAVMFAGSFAIRRSLDDHHVAELAAAIRRRRLTLFWSCYWLTLLMQAVFGRTPLPTIVLWLPLFAGGAFMFWPETHWIFGLPRIPPLPPQVRTPFVSLHRARDGSLSLVVDAPETRGLMDPILVRSGDSRIGIDRRYSAEDALRVFAVFAQGAQPPRVRVDLLDSSGQVRRSTSPALQAADLVGGKAPVRAPKMPIAKIDATVSLQALPPGRYVLRLTATDRTHRSEKYAKFEIAER